MTLSQQRFFFFNVFLWPSFGCAVRELFLQVKLLLRVNNRANIRKKSNRLPQADEYLQRYRATETWWKVITGLHFQRTRAHINTDKRVKS